MIQNVNCCKITQAPAPDHKAVILDILICNRTRGKGYWKLNNSVINEDKYKEGIADLYNEVTDEYGDHVPSGIIWEYLKVKIKRFTIHYCIVKSKSRENEIKDLEKKLDILDKSNTCENDKVRSQRRELKQALDLLYEYKATGYHIRSRARWVEDGEKSTSYFLRLEKARQSFNVINSLKDSSGQLHHSDDGILHTAKTFYEDLYKDRSTSVDDTDSYFRSITSENRLDDDNKLKCEGLVTHNECLKSLNKMKGNKSPGLDGITTEWYQAFWPLVGELLVDVFNEGHQLGGLSDSQRKAVMSLIFKKGDDDDISNYRPISLTNVDYRILAFTLAERIQLVISDITSTDQTAYIKRRYMGTNIRLVSDVIEHYNATNKSGSLLMLDFRKAFDTIGWNFLLQTLHFFNFGPSFIRWIETIYHKPLACIKNNGYLSDTVDISRGVCQGCPVSVLLFVLCVEILAIKIRNSSTLKGFQFGFESKPVKIAQYADDGILFLNDKNELCSALNILEIFGRMSGLVLNVEKCEGLWLGRNKFLQTNCTLFEIKWLEQFRCLGIYLGHNKQLNERRNFF